MDRGEIAVYRAIVEADLRGPALRDGHPAAISVQEGGNRRNATTSQGIDPLAYLRLKTVQTMGEANLSVFDIPSRRLMMRLTDRSLKLS
jgi:hypothetical protein